jgi:hypothetical protein
LRRDTQRNVRMLSPSLPTFPAAVAQSRKKPATKFSSACYRAETSSYYLHLRTGVLDVRDHEGNHRFYP